MNRRYGAEVPTSIKRLNLKPSAFLSPKERAKRTYSKQKANIENLNKKKR